MLSLRPVAGMNFIIGGLSTLGAKVLLDPDLSGVYCPVKGRTLIDGVFDVQSRSSFNQQSHNRVVAG